MDNLYIIHLRRKRRERDQRKKRKILCLPGSVAVKIPCYSKKIIKEP